MQLRREYLPGFILTGYALIVLLWLTALSWGQPIIEAHGFRQTQTAISALWIFRGYSTLSYLTPIMGAPWSIPFEFPVYQWIVACLANVSGLGIDHSGRLITLSFHLASAVLVYRTAALLSTDRRLGWISAGVFLAAPMGLFWARSVMIESAALFFSIAFVWSLVEYQVRPRLVWALSAAISAVTAVLTKVTTFYGFAVLACLGMMAQMFATGIRPWLRTNLWLLVCSAVSVLAALGALKLWLAHADALKVQALWGANITSTGLSAWNYGTLEQRMAVATWKDVAFGRSILDALGSRTLFAIATLIVLVSRRTRLAGVVMLVAYLAPFVTFTNLHVVHEYYQCANYVFISMIVALAIWRISGPGLPGTSTMAVTAAILVCLFSWWRLGEAYLPRMSAGLERSRTMQLAQFIRKKTEPDSVLVVLGMDWSSELAYYGDRRSIMLPDWTPIYALEQVARSDRPFGGLPLGALVECPNEMAKDPERAKLHAAIVARLSAGTTRAKVDGCSLHLRR